MGKSKYLGLVHADNPMFGGVELFSKADMGKKSQNLKYIKRVTIVWEGHDLDLDLSSDTWNLVQSGKKLTIEELDENNELSYRWLFNDEPQFSLIVDFGDPNHMRWLGQLADAQITDIQE